jgi:hypothetical protein
VNPIRPAGYPVQAPANPAADAARLAAQRAFFDQALGRAGTAAPAQAAATPQAVAASAPQPAPAPAQPLRAAPTDQPAEGPAKPPRPGSYLDIRV